MIKQSQLAKLLPRVLAGATVGGVHGYYAMPHMTGYEDEHGARKLSLLLNVLAGAAVGSAANKVLPGALKAQGFKGLGADVLRDVGKYKMPIAAGISADLLPNVMATMSQQRKATADMANSTRSASIPGAINGALTSGAGTGALAGAGVAGLAGVISGMLRRRTDEEDRSGRTRMGMAGSDALRYLLPAMAAGGVIGSLKKTQAA